MLKATSQKVHLFLEDTAPGDQAVKQSWQVTILPNGRIKVGHRWGQRHPQGANPGSNGILKSLSKSGLRLAATSPLFVLDPLLGVNAPPSASVSA